MSCPNGVTRTFTMSDGSKIIEDDWWGFKDAAVDIRDMVGELYVSEDQQVVKIELEMNK